ncbi:hypothetical protein B0H67DRAFT_209597 [Lasiosphaeris hirsuta]|uniref:Uncharacterized protein n=1 Tax=Lasiosphaeris hirsuta TaxID=260670 RepID=A0AA40AS43_9PEZI|nr:hypothetical protein B0H67DRAFT_209597 [Lasiosphaeris hirsuta]
MQNSGGVRRRGIGILRHPAFRYINQKRTSCLSTCPRSELSHKPLQLSKIYLDFTVINSKTQVQSNPGTNTIPDKMKNFFFVAAFLAATAVAAPAPGRSGYNSVPEAPGVDARSPGRSGYNSVPETDGVDARSPGRSGYNSVPETGGVDARSPGRSGYNSVPDTPGVGARSPGRSGYNSVPETPGSDA